MLLKFPKLTVATVIALPYVKLAYDYFIPNDGYAKARLEIQKQAEDAIEKTMYYIDRDLLALEANNLLPSSDPRKKKCDEVIPKDHIRKKVEILLAPEYRLYLLGDVYIVRWPPKVGIINWFFKLDDAKAMDDKIMRTLDLHNPNIKKLDDLIISSGVASTCDLSECARPNKSSIIITTKSQGL